MKEILAAFVGLGQGILIGSAAALFIIALNIIPQLTAISGTQRNVRKYGIAVAVGMFLAALSYTLDIQAGLGITVVAIYCSFEGIFIGILLCALVEVLNMLPVMYGKTRIKQFFRLFVIILAISKTLGGLLYYLIPVWP